MGWKVDNMPMETFDITILGKDISLVSERLYYATLGNGFNPRTREGCDTY